MSSHHTCDQISILVPKVWGTGACIALPYLQLGPIPYKTFNFLAYSLKSGGILALHAHCALLLDYVPPEEPLGTPLGNTLRIRRPKLDWRGP